MQLSTLLLSCLFILCLGRTIDTLLKHLKLDTGSVAAFSLLILMFGSFNPAISGEFSFNAGAVLMLLIMGRLAFKADGSLSRPMMFTLPSSLLMLAIELSGFNSFAALAVLPFVLTLSFAGAFFLAALAPLLICVYMTALDMYLYGHATITIGNAHTLNLQLICLFMAAVPGLVTRYRRSRLKADDL